MMNGSYIVMIADLQHCTVTVTIVPSGPTYPG